MDDEWELVDQDQWELIQPWTLYRDPSTKKHWWWQEATHHWKWATAAEEDMLMPSTWKLFKELTWPHQHWWWQEDTEQWQWATAEEDCFNEQKNEA